MAGLTDIQIGNFTKVYYEGDTPDKFEEITEIQSLTHPTDERNLVEVPQFGQDYPRKLSGSASTGNAEIVVNFNPNNTSHKQLLADYKSGAKRKFKIEVLDSAAGTNGSYFTFSGQVISKSSSGEFDAVLTMTFSLSVDGAISDWQDNA